jgi:hypothetical protein
MTTLPNMKVLVPADTWAAKKLFDTAMQTPGLGDDLRGVATRCQQDLDDLAG